ncbi:MAG: hypothetical protein ACLP59_23265 [Bryobacteraceae bacterium]
MRILFAIRGVRFEAALAVALSMVAGPRILSAGRPDFVPNVLYKAYGTFSQPPVSGDDVFRLQGEPFSISVVAKASSKPIHSGNGYAVYSPLVMTGTVKSGLLSSPTSIDSHSASIELQSGPAGESITLATPFKVVGLTLSIRAVIQLPPGTLANLYIHPFNAPVPMTGSNATLTYSGGTESTVLGISGMLTATLDTGSKSGRGATAESRPADESGAHVELTVLPRRRSHFV